MRVSVSIAVTAATIGILFVDSMPVKAPSSVIDFPGHLWTMCHPLLKTTILVLLSYMIRIRSISSL